MCKKGAVAHRAKLRSLGWTSYDTIQEYVLCLCKPLHHSVTSKRPGCCKSPISLEIIHTASLHDGTLVPFQNARSLSHVLNRGCSSQGEALFAWLNVATTQSKEGRNKLPPTQISLDVGIHEASAWWVLYTRHQHERAVAEMLSAKGFEVFLPLYESIRRWKDRQKLLTLPLFPCYVFVQGGLDRRLQVVTTPGIHTILFHGERVAIVPETEIRAIRRVVEGQFRVEPHPFPRCGERVRVTRGSLEGVEGTLVRKKNLYRLVLSVDMMAQSVAVEIDASDVEPVPVRELAGISPAMQSAEARGLTLNSHR
jgi:transcription antitermination factor NusG